MLKCKDHPRYKAIARPRIACEDCWRQYIDRHPTKLSPAEKRLKDTCAAINRQLDLERDFS